MSFTLATLLLSAQTLSSSDRPVLDCKMSILNHPDIEVGLLIDVSQADFHSDRSGSNRVNIDNPSVRISTHINWLHGGAVLMQPTVSEADTIAFKIRVVRQPTGLGLKVFDLVISSSAKDDGYPLQWVQWGLHGERYVHGNGHCQISGENML